MAIAAVSFALATSLGSAGGPCSWDRPGHDPFTGHLPAAVEHYADIPLPVRQRLRERMERRDYDDLVEITRDRISGKHAYSPEITGMHFGDGRVCGSVSRSRWSKAALERGLVYCDSGHCLLVPTVCRNLSRVSRRDGGPIDVEPAAGPGGAGVPGTAVPLGVPQAAAPTPADAESPGAFVLPGEPTGAGPATVLAPQLPPGLVLPGAPPTLAPLVPGLPSIPSTVPPGPGVLPPLLPPDIFLPPPVPQVPEPATLALWAAGLAAVSMAAAARRRRSAQLSASSCSTSACSAAKSGSPT